MPQPPPVILIGGQAPPSIAVPKTNNSGMYVVSWGVGGLASYFEVQEQINSGVWNDLSTVNTRSLNVSGKTNGTYRYRVRSCVDTCSGYITSNSVVVSLPGLASGNLTSASMANNRYFVKMIDHNLDGRKDIFVTGSSARHISDFLLQQGAVVDGETTWSLIKNPTSAATQLASSAPIGWIDVLREDMNGDGLFDFHLTGVENEIADGRELIILTKTGVGNEPSKVLVMGERFLNLVNQFETIIQNAEVAKSVATTNYCSTQYYYYPIYYRSYYPTYRDSSYSRWSYRYVYVPITYCYSGINLFSRDTQQFVLAMTGLDVAQTADIASPRWVKDVLGNINQERIIRNVLVGTRSGVRGIILTRRAAVMASVIVLANDVTVIGVADDLALIPLAASILVTVVAESLLDQVINILNAEIAQGNEDVGVRREYVYKYGAGAFAISVNCHPEAPNKDYIVKEKKSSDTLRTNLDSAGCNCPPNSAAHHIVPVIANTRTRRRLHKCLVDADIDLDSAINGVCLPNNPNEKTDAYKHRGRENTIHNDKVLLSIVKQCEDPNNDTATVLRKVADKQSKGQLF